MRSILVHSSELNLPNEANVIDGHEVPKNSMLTSVLRALHFLVSLHQLLALSLSSECLLSIARSFLCPFRAYPQEILSGCPSPIPSLWYSVP